MQPRVLVIEDDELTRRLCTDLLGHSGCEVMGATCATDGFNLALEHKPDVILIDVRIPNKEGENAKRPLGFDLCKALKSGALVGAVVILMTSCYGSNEWRIVGLENRADAYLDKLTMWPEVKARIEGVRQSLGSR